MPETAHPPRQPSILIGYGDFGTEVLQRLLASAALRGLLEWEVPEGAASPSERSLRDLALLSIGASPDPDGERDGDPLELTRDLYRQIRPLPALGAGEEDLVEKLVTVADALLSARQRDGQADRRPLALDVFVLAHLDAASDLGTLNRLLTPALERLARRTAMEAAVPGFHRVTFVQVLDFDDYWRTGDLRARELRRAVSDSLDHWLARSYADKPSYGRIYLLDGYTEEGHRDRRRRREEVVLFLEMLLFEGQRSSLQELFSRAGQGQPPATAFSIRLLEQPTALLQRLAAAHFGRLWLAWTAGEGRTPDEDRARAVRDFLARYDQDGFEELFRRRDLQGLLDQQAAELEGRLLALSTDRTDWPERLRQTWEEGAAELRDRLAGAVAERMEALRRERLTGFKEGLRAAVDESLHDATAPASPAAVLRELEGLLDRVRSHVRTGPRTNPEAPPPSARVDWSFAQDLHRRYRMFREERVDPSGLKRWWVLLAVVLAAAVTPFTVPLATDLLALVPIPDPVSSPPLVRQAHGLLQHLAHPTIQGLLLLGGFLTIGLLGVHRPLVARTAHAERFFDHPRRGRFTGRLRTAMAAGGELRAPLQIFLDHLATDMVAATFQDLRRDLTEIRTRLEMRHREMGWLRRELHRFLRVHRVGDEGRRNLQAASTPFRRSLEAPDDLETVQQPNRPIPDRFRAVQNQARLFQEWHQRYCETFLHPLDFIERLSCDFHDPWMPVRSGDGELDERWAEGLSEFVAGDGQLKLGFTVLPGDGVPKDQSYALLPRRWKSARLLSDLSASRFEAVRVFDSLSPGHAYLLRIQAGLPSEALRGEPR